MPVKEKTELDLIFREVRMLGLGVEEVEVDETVELGEALSTVGKGMTPIYCWVSSLGFLKGLLTLIEFKEGQYQLVRVDFNEDVEILGTWKSKLEALLRFVFELGQIYEKEKRK